MAKELPYFKFEPNQWDNGNIQVCSHEEKGVFVDLISMYWSRLGDVPYKLAVQKICGGNATALDSLCDAKIIEIIEGNIYIKFLSEQLDEFDLVSKTNSKNAKEGWEKRRKQKELSDPNATAMPSQSEPNAIREEERREEEIRKDKNKVPEFSEFLNHALKKEPLVNQTALKLKYDAWFEAGWKNGNGKKIINWKSNLNNTLPYLPKDKFKRIKEEGNTW